MAEEPEEITQEAQEWYISLFGVVGPQHDSEARSEHRIPKAPAKFQEYENDKKYFDPRVVSFGPYHHGEVHVTLFQMAEDDQQPDPEPRTDPSDEWFSSIFGDDEPDPDPRPKHRIPKVPTKFRNYEKDKKYFDPQVVSLGPYHHGKVDIESMKKHKITAAKQFIRETEGKEAIYRKFIELTDVCKDCYDAKVVATMRDDYFAGMMFLDGCFVLHFIDKISEEAETILEKSTELIPLIIRDMFLIENQLPFEVLDALMNLRRDNDKSGKRNIQKFFKWKVLNPMGFWRVNPSWSLKWSNVVDGREHDGPLHLLDILRTILLDFSTSKRTKEKSRSRSYRSRYVGSVMELEELGIRFEKRDMKSLMDISYKENLLFPQLLLPTMFIDDTTISQLLNLTALEACSDTYSGCGVTSFIHFMNSLINNDADVKMLRSKGILLHYLSSDNEVARLFKKWPAVVKNNLELYSYIIRKIRKHRRRRGTIFIATWLSKYFGSPWTFIPVASTALILVLAAIQTYLTAFPPG